MIEEFQDPLENYDPKEYNDPVERMLAEEAVIAIQHRPFTTISPDTTLREAIRILAELEISCLMVAEAGSLVGVLSERDILLKVGSNYSADQNRPVKDFMTPNPIYVHETSAAASALCVMAVSGYRHVPIVDLNGKIQGIASPQRVTEFLASHLDSE